MPVRSAIPAKQKKAVENAMEWLRNNDPNPDDLDEPAALALSNLTGIPLPKGTIPSKMKKQILDDAVDWLRNNDPNPHDVDEPTRVALSKLSSVPMPRLGASPAEKDKVVVE